jgi:tetratricopeptide (TPR) repeat protein
MNSVRKTGTGLNRSGMEAATEKHAVTPGEVLPAAELYGDMLLDAGRFSDALEAYTAALVRAPRRYNSLLGAARAATASGDDQSARMYYSEILDVASGATEARPGAREARDFLGKT